MKRLTASMFILFIPLILFGSVTIPAISEIEEKMAGKNALTEFKWEGGIIAGNGPVLNEQRNGRWTYAYKSKNETVKLYEGTYQRGVKTGHWLCFNMEGLLTAKDNYIQGQLSGACLAYYPSGQVHIQAEYSMNIRNGRYLEYYEDGKPKEISWYVNGEKDGQLNCWYPSGNKQTIGKYRLGKETGKWTFFRDDSSIASQGSYDNGKKIGVWTYTENGIIKTEQY
jgi:antitoxin component YwqK of YwqJK toxin-antitoxin module